MQRLKTATKLFFFFSLGAGLATIIISSLLYLGFTFSFRDKIYPGVRIAGVDVSGMTQEEVANQIVFHYPTNLDKIILEFSSPQATVSATGADLNLHLDTSLMAKRAFSIGRQTTNPFHNFFQIVSAWQGNINLPIEVTFGGKSFDQLLAKIAPKIEKNPIDATYHFVPGAGPDGKGRVTAFTPSENGVQIEREKLLQEVINYAKTKNPSSHWSFNVPTTVVYPIVKSSTADSLGIKNLIGEGLSYFYDSIPTRIYNIGLATGKISGSLVAPGAVFSFDNSIGTVSAIFGYKQAYVIKEGKTVLDDGGGVCQVSTTLYRAALNAGLPVVERVAHTYRVPYYEEGGFKPGLDATVYPPDPDLKFQNNTGGWLLIQANYDPTNMKLTFDIFGTDDGRKTQILGPYITSTAPPPPPIYQDDPSLPVGTVKQVDTAHWGANVYFQRIVTRNGQTLINETVKSDFIPWAARYLRGTKT